jgi:hypothetical protein
MPTFNTFKMPIGQSRLAYAVIMAVLIAVFMYRATVNLQWLTSTRIGYLAFGIIAGVALGIFEAKLVLSKLANAVEAKVWQVYPLGGALFGVPLLAVMGFLGSSEYAPFGLFAFFPLMISLFAVSGWLFSRFERDNAVHVFVFAYGFRYWVEPNPGSDDRLRYFCMM